MKISLTEITELRYIPCCHLLNAHDDYNELSHKPELECIYFEL